MKYSGIETKLYHDIHPSIYCMILITQYKVRTLNLSSQNCSAVPSCNIYLLLNMYYKTIYRNQRNQIDQTNHDNVFFSHLNISTNSIR